MAWARIEDDMPEHPKVVGVGPAAELMAYRAICYANRYLTDGFIPVGALPALAARLDLLVLDPAEIVPARLAERLVAGGLWHKARRGGFVIHDYLEYNFSRAEIQRNREHARKGGKKSAELRASGRLTDRSTVTQAISPTPKEERKSSTTRARGPKASSTGGDNSDSPVDRTRSVLNPISDSGAIAARSEPQAVPAAAAITGTGPLAGTIAHVLGSLRSPVGFHSARDAEV